VERPADVARCAGRALISYKQFMAELEDNILPGEAERRYVCSSALSCNFVCEGKRCGTCSIVHLLSQSECVWSTDSLVFSFLAKIV
jgi:hypothetical protein